MRRFITAASLVAIVGTLGACAESAGNTASPGTSTATAAAPPPSATAAAGNTEEICTAAKILVSDANMDAFGKTLGTLVTAHDLKNAELTAQATTAVQTSAGVIANQLGDLQQRATEADLKTALGTLASAFTAVGKDGHLAGVKSFDDAGQTINMLSPGLDAVDKICA